MAGTNIHIDSPERQQAAQFAQKWLFPVHERFRVHSDGDDATFNDIIEPLFARWKQRGSERLSVTLTDVYFAVFGLINDSETPGEKNQWSEIQSGVEIWLNLNAQKQGESGRQGSNRSRLKDLLIEREEITVRIKMLRRGMNENMVEGGEESRRRRKKGEGWVGKNRKMFDEFEK